MAKDMRKTKSKTVKPIEERTSFSFNDTAQSRAFAIVKERAVREGRNSLANACEVIVLEWESNRTKSESESQEKSLQKASA